MVDVSKFVNMLFFFSFRWHNGSYC